MITTGKFDFQFDPAIVRDLLDGFEQSDFFAMSHEDNWGIRDAASEILTLKYGERTRSSTNRWGGATQELDPADARFHTELSELAALIDKSVQVERWIGTEGDRQKEFDK